MYNEEENAEAALNRIRDELDSHPELNPWEIVAVDDGSTDRTAEVVRSLAAAEPRIRLLQHPRNYGRGRALRTGFGGARGEYIVTIDADLSYSPEHITRLAAELQHHPELDIVLGSAYMPGGSTAGVPLWRLAVSRVGNIILSHALGGRLHTVTCVLRGYRRRALRALELEADGKEIHLEIISKALALGMEIKEIPAHLTGRKRGKSSFRLRRTSITHLLFSIAERPMTLFGALGALLIVLGLVAGIHILRLWRQQSLNPDRPLMTLMVLLIVTGMQVLAFGFIGTQIAVLRRELFKLQREHRLLKYRLGIEEDKGQRQPPEQN